VLCVVSWAGVAAGVVLSCSPLDRPCDGDELGALLGSELCTVVGAVLCVVGVACGLDVEPFEAPGAVLCVVGVVWVAVEPFDASGAVPCVPCGLDVEPFDTSGAVPCVVGDEVCGDGDVVAVEVPDAGAGVLSPVPLWVPVSACGALPWPPACGAGPCVLGPVPLWMPVSACGALP
jgi:hypothetical protein